MHWQSSGASALFVFCFAVATWFASLQLALGFNRQLEFLSTIGTWFQFARSLCISVGLSSKIRSPWQQQYFHFAQQASV